VANVTLYDPVTFESWRLQLRHLRCEEDGPLFEKMALRIEAIASLTGMKGIFRLIGADVFEVEAIEPVTGFLSRPAGAGDDPTLDGIRTELRGLQWVSFRVNRAEDLESLLETVLEALDTYFGFRHTMVLLHEETSGRLVTLASRGYAGEGIGSEVQMGEGLLGTVARERRALRVSSLQQDLLYGRAMRRELMKTPGPEALASEIPLPGLQDAKSALVIPLAVRDRLLGVLSAESRDPLAFHEWHEAYLEVVGNQIALSLERMLERAAALEREDTPLEAPHPAPAPTAGPSRTVTFYKKDDSVFVDGEYLIKNVPARILWKLLGEWRRTGRTEFTNRELRLDPWLGLPELRDNLESRLILLRRRLEQKSPDLKLVGNGRGRFRLEVAATLSLDEREGG
jgi:adenylate cyclase